MIRYSFVYIVLFLGIVNYSYAQLPLEIIQKHLSANASTFGLNQLDVSSLEITATASSQAKDVTHYYIRQVVNGIPVYNGLATVTVKGNKVLQVAPSLVSLSNAPVKTPTVKPEQSVLSALNQLGYPTTTAPLFLGKDKKGGVSKYTHVQLVEGTIPVQLMYFSVDGKLELVWDMNLEMKDHAHWWSAQVSAETGQLVSKNDWSISCNHDHSLFEKTVNEKQKIVFPILRDEEPTPPPAVGQYKVLALPIESPNHGKFSVVTDPADKGASPFGWHDVNGVPGEDYTITRGNNVHAYEDVNRDNKAGYSPDGGANLNFNFTYDSTKFVQGNMDVVITNLFYWNNMIHDIMYYYGFNETSGNFQQKNYIGNGQENDHVLAEAQDGSGTNNANFSSPVDGKNGRMQMYLWSNTTGNFDLLEVKSPSSVAKTYKGATNSFGVLIPYPGITGDMVMVRDTTGDTLDGCSTFTNADKLAGKIVVLRRGSCSVTDRLKAIQMAGGTAAVFINSVNATPTQLTGNIDTTLKIPAVVIAKNDGDALTPALLSSDTVKGRLFPPFDKTSLDSDFDNVVIVHEYGHGISTRLTGGAANSDCLRNQEQMGEGWSDYFGLMLSMKPGDKREDKRGIATYLQRQATNGVGIRPVQYSTSTTVNKYTYKNTNDAALLAPHGIGFVWCTMLWELTWDLIDIYGFDPNLKNGSGGNNIAMALVMEGLKMQRCNPGFVDGRNAILAADQVLFGGQYNCIIWKSFAKRGLGYSAQQGSSILRNDQIEAFDRPYSCVLDVEENNLDQVRVYPNPTQDVFTVNAPSKDVISTIRITDIQGKLILEKNVSNQETATIDLTPYQSGVFLVQLIGKNGSKTISVVKN